MKTAICVAFDSQLSALQRGVPERNSSFLSLVSFPHSHHSWLRTSVSLMHLLPLLLRKRLNWFKLLLLQSGIDYGQLLGGELVQFFDYIFQFMAQRIGAFHLGDGRLAIVVVHVAVDAGQIFTDAFFAGDGAALFGGYDLGT